MTQRHPSRAFSLVELLIVLAVVAVLASLLLPSLARARDLAKCTTCKSQQRQIIIAYSGYLGDWKRTYPFGNPARPGFINTWPSGFCYPWTIALAPYLGQYTMWSIPKILQCPSNPWPAFILNDQNNPPSSYGTGDAFPGNWHDGSSPVKLVASLRESQLIQPSKVLLLGEIPNAADAYGRNFAFWGASYVSFQSATNYSGPAPVGYWYSDEIAGRTTPSPGNPIARVNHFLSWNSGMADGSVKLTSKATLRVWADQITTLTPYSDGLMFWYNRTK